MKCDKNNKMIEDKVAVNKILELKMPHFFQIMNNNCDKYTIKIILTILINVNFISIVCIDRIKTYLYEQCAIYQQNYCLVIFGMYFTSLMFKILP